jgi:hypothetical protein
MINFSKPLTVDQLDLTVFDDAVSEEEDSDEEELCFQEEV